MSGPLWARSDHDMLIKLLYAVKRSVPHEANTIISTESRLLTDWISHYIGLRV